MSIIHDALKKVQQTNNPGGPTPPSPYQDPVQPPGQPKPDTINIPLLVAALCAVIAMIFAVVPQTAPKKPAAPTASAETKQPEPKTAAPTVKTPSSDTLSKAVANAASSPAVPAIKPSVQKIADPNDPLSSIQIEGIMDMDGKKVALISGNVYEEGQTIYGKVISEITFDSLTVIEDGGKRVFSTKP